jgi:hypothetical protein
MTTTTVQEPEFWTPDSTWPPYAADFVLPSWLDAGFQCVVEHYRSVGVPLPERQYWTIGQTAHDCEQIVLTIQQMFLGTADNMLATNQCNAPRSITFAIEVIRCVPVMSNRGQAPSAQAIETSSVNPVIDMEILMDVASCFDQFNVGIVVTIDAFPAQGGFHGMVATYTATL